MLAVLLHRTGPISAYDFLSAQFLFVASSIATWAIFESFPEFFVRSSDLATVALVTALSYALAALLMVVLPEPRAVAITICRKLIALMQ